MIYANEAKKITKENNDRDNAIKKAVDEMLTKIEPSILEKATRGFAFLKITKMQIIDIMPYNEYFFTIKEMMDAVAKELKEYGYKVEITASHSSIHVEW